MKMFVNPTESSDIQNLYLLFYCTFFVKIFESVTKEECRRLGSTLKRLLTL